MSHSLLAPTTPESAYLLGFLWADGYIAKAQNRITVEILLEDFKQIQNIVLLTGNWHLYPRHRINRQPQMNAVLCDDKPLHTFLVNNDYTSKTLAPHKILSIIPTALHPYWFRGLSDGDGCFYHGPVTKPISLRNLKHFFIGSTYEQDWSYIEILFKNLHIKYSIKQGITKSGNKDSIIRVTNAIDIVKFGDYIYNDRFDIGLQRKRTKYLGIRQSVGI